MSLFDGNFSNFTSPLELPKLLENSLPSLPNWNLDLTNPSDSKMASQGPLGLPGLPGLSGLPGLPSMLGGDSSAGGGGGGGGLFGSLDFGDPLHLFGSASSDKQDAGGSPLGDLSKLGLSGIEMGKSLLNSPFDLAESLTGGDPLGLFQLGRDINDAPLKPAETLLAGGGAGGDALSFSDRASSLSNSLGTTRDAVSDLPVLIITAGDLEGSMAGISGSISADSLFGRNESIALDKMFGVSPIATDSLFGGSDPSASNNIWGFRGSISSDTSWASNNNIASDKAYGVANPINSISANGSFAGDISIGAAITSAGDSAVE